MKTVSWIISYKPENNDGVFGKLLVDGIEEMLMCGLPYRNNEKGVSRIPDGVYWLKPHQSPAHGFTYKVWWCESEGALEEPRGRSDILIHCGNHVGEIEGCMMPGMTMGCFTVPFRDSVNQRLMAQSCCDVLPLNYNALEKKGINGVNSSRMAFKRLRELLGDTETHRFIISEKTECPTHY